MFIDEKWDDGKSTKPKEGRPLLNMVCWGTGLQQAVWLNSRESSEMLRVYRTAWKRQCGTPERMVSD